MVWHLRFKTPALTPIAVNTIINWPRSKPIGPVNPHHSNISPVGRRHASRFFFISTLRKALVLTAAQWMAKTGRSIHRTWRDSCTHISWIPLEAPVDVYVPSNCSYFITVLATIQTISFLVCRLETWDTECPQRRSSAKMQKWISRTGRSFCPTALEIIRIISYPS